MLKFEAEMIAAALANEKFKKGDRVRLKHPRLKTPTDRRLAARLGTIVGFERPNVHYHFETNEPEVSHRPRVLWDGTKQPEYWLGEVEAAYDLPEVIERLNPDCYPPLIAESRP